MDEELDEKRRVAEMVLRAYKEVKALLAEAVEAGVGLDGVEERLARVAERTTAEMRELVRERYRRMMGERGPTPEVAGRQGPPRRAAGRPGRRRT